jgi:hypothetical protein
MSILSLVDKKREIDQGVIDVLERALADAREGKILDLVVAYSNTDLGFRTDASYVNYLSAVGLVTMLQRDIIDTGDLEPIGDEE